MQIKFSDLAINSFFKIPSTNKIYIKDGKFKKESVISRVITDISPDIIVAPLYDGPVDVNFVYGSHFTTEYRNEAGHLHRENGPAVERSTGTKMWYVNGTRHRLDGPAAEFADGTKEYWVNGIDYNSYLEYLIAAEEYNLNNANK